MLSSIAKQTAAHNEAMKAELPPHVASVFLEEQRALDVNGHSSHETVVGSEMPDAPLLDGSGGQTSLRVVLAGRPSVVVFYRGAWCPYCNIALRAYERELVEALRERGVSLVAISPQKPDGSLAAELGKTLSFPTFADPDDRIAAALGIVTAPSPEAIVAQRELGLVVADQNVDGTSGVPMPTVVLVDAAGVIRWIDVHANYASRTEAADILKALDLIEPRTER